MTIATIENPISTRTASTEAAVLPYPPLWAAAQFVSTDVCKEILTFVHVKHVGEDFIQIEATCGHRAFRYRFRTDGEGCKYFLRPGGLLIHGKALKKFVGKAGATTHASVSHDMILSLHSGEALVSSMPCSLPGYVNASGDTDKLQYPNLDQLWPSEFRNTPGAPYALDSKYLESICKVTNKISSNGRLRIQGNAPTTPWCLSCDYTPLMCEESAEPKLEFLIMPVIIRKKQSL